MAEITKKDIFDTLSEFFGKVIEPRFDRIEKTLDEHGQNFETSLSILTEFIRNLIDLRRNIIRSFFF